MHLAHACAPFEPSTQAPQDIASRGGALVKIPMDETHVRSLNGTSVGIGLYEVRLSICESVCAIWPLHPAQC
jgi:hypothetical protein